MNQLERYAVSLDSLEGLRARLAKYEDADGKPLAANAVVMPEPDFYWVEADEGSWNSPEEWAQDYYDYNGEKPESVSFSCAVELPTREYDSFEFDANGHCISCRLVSPESAAPTPAPKLEPAHSDVSVPRELAARIADPFTSTSNLIENLRELRALLNVGQA